MLIDSHAHIYDEQYGDGGKSIIANMRTDGLAAIVTVGCDEQSSAVCVDLAKHNDGVYAAVGVHPYYPETVTDELIDKLRKLAECDKVVAIGEFGLDYHHDVFDRDAQIAAMEKQYELARELRLPMIFHVREAIGDFVDFIRAREFPESGVLHCFAGSTETAEICLKKNLYISFGGKLTYKNSRVNCEVAKYVPLDRIIVETDAPYLSPSQCCDRINYPKNVAYVRDKIASLRGITADEVERITYDNTKRLFFGIK